MRTEMAPIRQAVIGLGVALLLACCPQVLRGDVLAADTASAGNGAAALSVNLVSMPSVSSGIDGAGGSAALSPVVISGAPASGTGLTPVFDPVPLQLGSFGIGITNGGGMTAPALAAFNRAAAQWQARIADPITVNITASMAALGPGILGSTSNVLLQDDYTTVRNQVVADAADEADDAIVGFLPIDTQFSVYLPAGFGLNGNVFSSKAEFKAIGYTGLDGAFGANDGTITFSTGFSFDFDNSDGVTAGTIDFETVAAHEIGHILGFVSAEDNIDNMLHLLQVGNVGISVLDLFRFANNLAGSDPATAADFTTFDRSLVPGVDEITDQVLSWGPLGTTEFRMSTGFWTGDGRQASHWKDNDLTGTLIGNLDPTLAYATIVPITEADWRAMDLIGYEILPIPEPTSLLLLAGGLAVLRCRRRR